MILEFSINIHFLLLWCFRCVDRVINETTWWLRHHGFNARTRTQTDNQAHHLCWWYFTFHALLLVDDKLLIKWRLLVWHDKKHLTSAEMKVVMVACLHSLKIRDSETWISFLTLHYVTIFTLRPFKKIDLFIVVNCK